MSTQTLEHLRSQINDLSESERAALAHELIGSLDGTHDNTAAQAWDEEIVARVARVSRGDARLLTREQFRARMNDALKPR